jgi:cytochrome c oxidase subunit 2
VVEVVAQQFQWNFHYSGKDGVMGRTDPNLVDDSALNYIGLDQADPNAKDDVVHSVIAVPEGRPVELILRSRDVIHNFWVPQLRFKQDLVPGMMIRVHFDANRPGKYELACAELCGQFHFRMRSFMLVLPADEHQALMAMPQDQFQTRMTELLAKYQLPNYQQ